eukprot:1184398-Prorocentrum_minimum.AAC.4
MSTRTFSCCEGKRCSIFGYTTIGITGPAHAAHRPPLLTLSSAQKESHDTIASASACAAWHEVKCAGEGGLALGLLGCIT